MQDKNFREWLTVSQRKKNSLLAVGLDPLIEKLPDSISKRKSPETRITIWMHSIIDATAACTCMYKLQSASYEILPSGFKVMRDVVSYIKKNYPEIIVIIDGKRGDIARTQKLYVDHFWSKGFDGMTFSPYMGSDALVEICKHPYTHKSPIGLCYTTNPSAREVQDVQVCMPDGACVPYWFLMLRKIHQWSWEVGACRNAGVVMAAAQESSEEISGGHLLLARQEVGDDLWFLAPGIETQGGSIEKTLELGYVGYGSITLSASSSIIFASSGTDYAKAAAQKVHGYTQRIHQTIL